MKGQGGLLKRALLFFMGLPTTTLEGRFFLAGVVALGFLSSATDRNYVLLVLAILLTVIVVSVAFSTWNLSGIEYGRSLPEAVTAGESFTVRVRLANRRRWLPARNVLIKDALQTALSGAESRCFAPRIPAGGRVTFVYTASIRRRGAYNITNALLSTRFPFGLFEKRSLARHPTRIVVYPRVFEVAGERLPGTRDVHVALRKRTARRRGGDEFRSLRDYRPGDDPRRIAWRASARQNRLVLKEMEQENRGRVAILLSTSLAGVRATERRAAMEKAVSLAASLLRHLHRERRPFLFAAPGLTLGVFHREEAVHACLEHLSTIRADHRHGASSLLRSVGIRRLRSHDVILIAPGPVEIDAGVVQGYRLHPVAALSKSAAQLLRRGW